MKAKSSFLLIVLIYVIKCRGVFGDLSSNDPSPYKIVLVGLPESKTDEPFKDDSLMVKHTRQLEATYQWNGDLKVKCGYKVKAEAIRVVQTTTKVFGNPEQESRYFVKIYIDHKLLDIIEYEDNMKFDDNVIKYGFFIQKVIKYSCYKLEFEYLTKGKGCQARTYEKQTIYREEIEGQKRMLLEDWRWIAFDEDECENRSVPGLEVGIARKSSSRNVFII